MTFLIENNLYFMSDLWQSNCTFYVSLYDLTIRFKLFHTRKITKRNRINKWKVFLIYLKPLKKRFHISTFSKTEFIACLDLSMPQSQAKVLLTVVSKQLTKSLFVSPALKLSHRKCFTRKMGSNVSPNYLGLDLSTQQVRKYLFFDLLEFLKVFVEMLYAFSSTHAFKNVLSMLLHSHFQKPVY